jgi:hypothetical protein
MMRAFLTRTIAKIRNLRRSQSSDAELEREIALHVAMLEEEYERRGKPWAAWSRRNRHTAISAGFFGWNIRARTYVKRAEHLVAIRDSHWWLLLHWQRVLV